MVGCFNKSTDSVENTEKTQDNSASTNLSGLVVKGILKNAEVSVDEYIDSSWINIGNATTDNDGAYTAKLTNYKGGPIRLTAEAKDDTKMVCDATEGCKDKTGATIDFGGDISVSASLSLQSILPDKHTKAHINPFTDIAAANILNGSTTIDSDKIKQVTAKVASIFGLTDIQNVRPIDVTVNNNNLTASEKKMGLALITFADSLNDYKSSDQEDKTVDDFMVALKVMREDFQDGSFDLNQKPEMPGKKSFLETFMDKKQAHLDNNKTLTKLNFDKKLVSVEKNIMAVKKHDIEKAKQSGNLTLTPKEVNTSLMDDIGKAKALVSDARSLFHNLEKLKNPAEAFSKNINTAHQVVGDRFQDHFNILDAIGEALADKPPKKTTNNSKYPIFLPPPSNCSSPSVVCATLAREVNAIITVSDSVADGLIIKLKADATDKNTGFNITLSSPQARLADLNKKDLDRKLEKISMKMSGWIEDKDKSRTEFNNLTLTHEFDKAYNSSKADLFDRDKMKKNVLKSDKLSFTKAASGDQLQVGFEGAIEVVTVSADAEFANDNESGHRPKKMFLKGKFIHGNESFEMAVDVNILNAERMNRDKEVYAKFDLRISMDTHFSGYPKTLIVIAADGTEYVGGKATVTISQKEKGRSLTFFAEKKSKDGIINQLSIQASDGVKMIVKIDDQDQKTGTIIVNDNQVATITEEGFIKVSYTDGTFDSF